MALAAYATSAQLTTYLPTGTTLPTDANRLLVRASDRVDDFVLAAFTVDPITGLARDGAVAAALTEAACAQVEFWMEVGEEHDVDGVRGSVSAPGVEHDSPPSLAPRARSALTRAGLMGVGGIGT